MSGWHQGPGFCLTKAVSVSGSLVWTQGIDYDKGKERRESGINALLGKLLPGGMYGLERQWVPRSTPTNILIVQCRGAPRSMPRFQGLPWKNCRSASSSTHHECLGQQWQLGPH